MLTIFLFTFALVVLVIVISAGIRRVSDSGRGYEDEGIEDQLSQLDVLTHQRLLLKRELKDIELDHATSKIDAEDFERLKKRFQRNWLRVDAKLRTLSGETDRTREALDEELDERLRLAQQDRRRSRRADRIICGSCGAANAPKSSACGACLLPINEAPTPHHDTTPLPGAV